MGVVQIIATGTACTISSSLAFVSEGPSFDQPPPPFSQTAQGFYIHLILPLMKQINRCWKSEPMCYVCVLCSLGKFNNYMLIFTQIYVSMDVLPASISFKNLWAPVITWITFESKCRKAVWSHWPWNAEDHFHYKGALQQSLWLRRLLREE